MTVSTACGLLLGLKGQGHEAAVLVQRSDPRSWPSHWYLVSSGRTLQLEGSTSKPWPCTRAKSVAAAKGPFDVGGAKSAAWESRWADFSLWVLTCLVLKWPGIYWEMCLNLHTEIIWGCSHGILWSQVSRVGIFCVSALRLVKFETDEMWINPKENKFFFPNLLLHSDLGPRQFRHSFFYTLILLILKLQHWWQQLGGDLSLVLQLLHF